MVNSYLLVQGVAKNSPLGFFCSFLNSDFEMQSKLFLDTYVFML